MKKRLEKRMKKEWRNILFNAGFAIATLLAVILFFRNEVFATLLVFLVGVIGLVKWKSKVTSTIFLVSGIFGAFAEMVVIYASGAWSYAFPTVLGLIPSWLFVVWANAGAFICESSKEFRILEAEK